MQDLMFPDLPSDERERLLRDNADQIVERCYTRKFDQPQINERRAELANVSIQINELEDELAQIRADIKGRIKPLAERHARIIDELKAGGEWCKTDCYKFVDADEGKTAFYSPEGYKLEERPMTPEERQRTVFTQLRKTGTDD